MLDYAEIIKKLGFNPLVECYNYHYKGHEDDSQVSPFSVLSIEERNLMLDKMREQKTTCLYSDEEQNALLEKDLNPEKKVLCPRCGQELKYCPKEFTHTIQCTTKGCIRYPFEF